MRGEQEMAIERETIEAIKRDVDLVPLVEAKGIELKKNGKSYFGLCPFHDDTNPSLSINPTKNLWQCFGCGAGGDVIRFVELIDKVTFPEAVSQLIADSSQLIVKPKPTSRRKHKCRVLISDLLGILITNQDVTPFYVKT
jgi:DNA primase